MAPEPEIEWIQLPWGTVSMLCSNRGRTLGMGPRQPTGLQWWLPRVTGEALHCWVELLG